MLLLSLIVTQTERALKNKFHQRMDKSTRETKNFLLLNSKETATSNRKKIKKLRLFKLKLIFQMLMKIMRKLLLCLQRCYVTTIIWLKHWKRLVLWFFHFKVPISYKHLLHQSLQKSSLTLKYQFNLLMNILIKICSKFLCKWLKTLQFKLIKL